MLDWSRLGGNLDFCAVYFTIQLVRCAAFSFVLAGLVMALRKLFFSKQAFFRGMLWTLFLAVPFLGRLRLFYENTFIGKADWWMAKGLLSCLWIGRIYMAGILTAGICIFWKRLCLWRAVARMEKTRYENIRIRITKMNITPFAVGLRKPEIVLPKGMIDGYSRDELKIILQHEQTHIRLGHLWCGFAWDILRCLLWVNPFLSIFQKYLRADMEDICDRVCIQNSGRTAHEYGLVLLKSLKLLCSGQEEIPSAATYAGETDFSDMKRRMREIAGFRPYPKRFGAGVAVVTGIAMGSLLLMIHAHSYARCNESTDIMVYQYDGEAAVISNDTESLSRMISYDDSYVYVDREAFENFLCQNNAAGEIYIVFGGSYKLPGMGAVAESCYYNRNSVGRTVQISYKSIKNHWDYILFQLL